MERFSVSSVYNKSGTEQTSTFEILKFTEPIYLTVFNIINKLAFCPSAAIVENI